MDSAVKTKRGTVVSDKMDQTIVVNIDRVKVHPIYKKKFTVSKKYVVDNPQNKYKVGDVVDIVETRPMSKSKKFKVLRKI